MLWSSQGHFSKADQGGWMWGQSALEQVTTCQAYFNWVRDAGKYTATLVYTKLTTSEPSQVRNTLGHLL